MVLKLNEMEMSEKFKFEEKLNDDCDVNQKVLEVNEMQFEDQRVVADEAEVVDKYFVCRKYREGDVIGKEHMERFTKNIKLIGGPTIETVRARYCDKIKPVVRLFPDEWKQAQRDKLRWYPIKLDGRTMSITRDSGAIENIAFPAWICAKEDSDIQISIGACAANTSNA